MTRQSGFQRLGRAVLAAMAAGLLLAAPAVEARMNVEPPTAMGRTPSDLYALRPPYVFTHNVGLLTLQITNVGIIGNPFIAFRFRRAVDRVLAGEPLSRALTAVGQFSPIVIQMIAVGSAEDAALLAFPGSPTIRIDGVDILHADRGDIGLAPRTYPDGSGVPSKELIRDAVERARGWGHGRRR